MKTQKASDTPMNNFAGSSFGQNVVSIWNRKGGLFVLNHEDAGPKEKGLYVIAHSTVQA